VIDHQGLLTTRFESSKQFFISALALLDTTPKPPSLTLAFEVAT
jgi:hypothetical protein